MKPSLLFMLSVAVTGCAAIEPRYSSTASSAAPTQFAMSPIASIEFVDSAGGLQEDGVLLVLKRPLIQSVREGVLARLATGGAVVGSPGGMNVRVVMTHAALKRGKGYNADLKATINFTVGVSSGGRTMCERDASSWAVVHERFYSTPAEKALNQAFSKAVDNVGEAMAASCLGLHQSITSVSSGTVAGDVTSAAVIIGVERHRGGRWPADSAADDAKEFARAIRDAALVRDDRLALLIDDEATLADLNKHLDRWLPDHVTPGGRVFVYFSGFGASDAKGDSYLVPFDIDPSYVDATGFPLQKFLNGLGRFPATVTVVLDASFSGNGGRTLASEGAALKIGEIELSVPDNVTLLQAASPGRSARSASGHGSFTAAILRGMRRGGDLSTAFDAAVRELPDQQPRRRGTQ